MNHYEGTLRGVRDSDIYYQAWRPDGEARAVLIIVHGLAEHSGRYGNLVRRFVPQGYAVCALDHVGHGRSGGLRAYVERFADFSGTLALFVERVRGLEADTPLFLVGHSMGGLIAGCYLIGHQALFAGAILSGPSVRVPENLSAVTAAAGRLLSVLMPRAGILALDAEGVSRDPAVVRAYREDPLVHTGKVTARLGAELLRAMKQLSDEAAAITLPLLVLQGGCDRLVDPAGARWLYEAVGSTDKTLTVYEDAYHEVFNDPGYDRVLDDVERWLAAHLPAAGGGKTT